MIKLTPRQAEVVRLMQEGCSLQRPLDYAPWILDGFRFVQFVGLNVLGPLLDNGLLRYVPTKRWCPVSMYKLTTLGHKWKEGSDGK